MSDQTPKVPTSSVEILGLMVQGAIWAGLVLGVTGGFIFVLYLISTVLPTG